MRCINVCFADSVGVGLCCGAGRRALSAAIVDRGLVSVNCHADLGATPLMVACAARHLDVAELLLDCGADADLATPDGWRAVHVAVRACAAPIVRLLVAKGRADPDAVSLSLTHGGDSVPASTPLLIAISLNSVRMLRHLLDAGADVNLAGLVSVSPQYVRLNAAAAASLSSGSDSDDAAGLGAAAVCSSGSDDVDQRQTCSPLQFAVVSRAWDVAELLIRAGAATAPVTPWLDPTAPAAGTQPHPAVGGGGTQPQSSAGTRPLVPHDHAAYLRRVIALVTASPAKLSHLARLRVRRLVGRQLASKLVELNLPLNTQQYLLFYDLFHAHSGTFDI